MRGKADLRGTKFSLVTAGQGPEDHAIRHIKPFVGGTLLVLVPWASLKTSVSKMAARTRPLAMKRTPAYTTAEGNGRRTLMNRPESRSSPGKKATWRGSQAMFCRECPDGKPEQEVADVTITQASDAAERDAALDMLKRVLMTRRLTVGANQGL